MRKNITLLRICEDKLLWWRGKDFDKFYSGILYLAIKMQVLKKKVKLYKSSYQNRKPQEHEILQVKYMNYLTCGCTVKTVHQFLITWEGIQTGHTKVAKIKHCKDTQDLKKKKKLNNERTTAYFRWHHIKINMQADIRKH